MTIPPCQPPAYLGMGMPQDAAEQVGFLPRVATWLPDTVYWYTAGAYSSQALLSQPRPWMRIEYGYNFPRPYNAYAPHVVIAFDETKQELGFTTNIYVPGQTLAVTSKTPVDINGQEGEVWVRATAVTSGRYVTDDYDSGDDVLAWDGMNTDVLLRVARSARPYTGCPRTVSGAS